jgi:hypothetical protein
VIAILQGLKAEGWSQRELCDRLGLVRSSVRRWSANLAMGFLAIRTAATGKLPLRHPIVLHADIARMKHGLHRTPGALALWLRWRAWISQRALARLLRRRRQLLARRRSEGWQRLMWRVAGAVWAMDPGQLSGLRWNLVGDAASRFRFPLDLAEHLPAAWIAARLRWLFEQFGAPLLIKHDSGSNLCHPRVMAVKEAFSVLTLLSPLHYPRYNGAIEYAQREIKETALFLFEQGCGTLEAALQEAPAILNAQPRPCLGGETAEAVFYTSVAWVQRTYTMSDRKEIKDWIEERERTIVAAMTDPTRHQLAAARRQAIETWMLNEGLVAFVAPPKPLPHSS